MYITLREFNGDRSIYAFVRTIDKLEELQEKCLNILFHDGDKCYLYPEGKMFQVSETEKIRLDMLWEEDVLQFAGTKAYLFYSNESDDNAFMVTGKCNSNCIMCPASESMRKNADSAYIDELLEIARHIPDNDSHITITGGEPFMVGKSLFRLLSYFKEYKSRHFYLILTNGRIFANHEYSRLLAESIPPRVELGIPLHGYNAKTHDYVTQAKGSFDQTVSGLRNLLAQDTPIELRYVVSRLTKDYITEMSEFVTQSLPGIGCVKIMGLEMLGNAAVNAEEVWVDYRSAFESSKKGIDILLKHGIDVELYNFPLCCVDPGYWGIYRQSITDYKIRYLDECNNCIEKKCCGGIFAGTIRLVKTVSPII